MRKKISWSRKGDGYEVSSVGDRRFSPFYARMPDNRSIEVWYQCDIKGYDPGGTNWRLGKGKPPLNELPEELCYQAFKSLWLLWLIRRPAALVFLRDKAEKHNYLLTDCFASTPVNQARALSEILNEWV